LEQAIGRYPFVHNVRDIALEGDSERCAEMAAELVRLQVDVIVTSGIAVVAAKQATSVIPIVFAVAADPVGTGLVASLARPGRQCHWPVNPGS
jgi:ABC-type uncharacterized transport system substrate-binding protein